MVEMILEMSPRGIDAAMVEEATATGAVGGAVAALVLPATVAVLLLL